MQVFFVIDSLAELDFKINLIQNFFSNDIKFFINSKFYGKIYNNQYIMSNTVKIFEGNEKAKIDDYLKSDKCNIDDTFLYYSSVKLSKDILQDVTKKKMYNYDAIYFKKKENAFSRFLKTIYQKIVNILFRVEDAFCSTKIQYISANFMENLKKNKFNNHIFKAKNSSEIELENANQAKTLSNKITFNMKSLYILIGLFASILLFVVLDVYFKLMFWVYFLFFMIVLLSIILFILMLFDNIFRSRYKK